MIDGVHGTHNAVPDDRNKDVLIYVNGELTTRENAKISVFDSGYLVGDGIWEALRLHDGVLVFLDEHLDRLWTAAATVGMKLPWTEDELVDEIWKTLNANKMHDNVHCRFMVTRGIMFPYPVTQGVGVIQISFAWDRAIFERTEIHRKTNPSQLMTSHAHMERHVHISHSICPNM